MLSQTPQIIGRRYVLHDPLGEGGMGAVYRATDRLTSLQVALKQVVYTDNGKSEQKVTTSSNDYRLALAQEFKMLASLRHPNIISVLDYGFDEERQPYFTMELLENAQTIIEAGAKKPLNVQIGLIVQMLQALAYLHRRGIIHRDLKPKNVLVVNDQVKVLDFGLSTGSDQEDHEGNSTAGTLAYMAPEVLLGEPATEAADLYAVGMMAYELFAGYHPYDTQDLSALINNVLYAAPTIQNLNISGALGLILERLVAKSRETRYTSASQVITEIVQATDYPITLETSATRESFLQAARLVGRQKELRVLSDALANALAGKGSAWLIGGESGVGKSRLVEELRTVALVRGAAVSRGQGVSESSTPYYLWRPTLRWLTLVNSDSLDDQQASILKLLIPDIGALIGRDIPDEPEQDLKAVQTRLITAIEDLFRRQTQPLVVILEDLHWASESVDVLSRLVSMVKELPIFLLASYRDDESPDVPVKVPGMNVLKLDRLTEDAISELSAAMLGENGKQPHVVELLQRETEGNVFFLVEVVRVLAEEAGQLDRIGMTTLPGQIFVGGIQQIVQRRLLHVPREHHPLLRIAAVFGRHLNLELLKAVEPEIDIDRWLTICSDAAVLDVQDGEWRFAHDKLRDGVLNDLRPEQRAALHERIADTLERLYPNSADITPALAYHYRKAGNTAKELQYSEKAGRHVLLSGVYKDAVYFLERALLLTTDQQSQDADDSRLREVHLRHYLAQAKLGLGNYHEAKVLYQQNLTTCQALDDTKHTADTLINLGDVAIALGNNNEAKQQYETALEMYRGLANSQGTARALNSLGNVAYEAGDINTAKQLYQESFALSKESGSQWGMAGAIRNVIGVSDKEYDSTLVVFQNALQTYQAAGHFSELIEAFQRLTEVTDNHGEYAATLTLFHTMLNDKLTASDSRVTVLCLHHLGIIASAQRNGKAMKYLADALQLATTIPHIPFVLDILVSISQDMIRSNDKEAALELLATALHHPESTEKTQDKAERLLFDLEAEMHPAVISAAWERGKGSQINTLVAKVTEKYAPKE